MLCILTETVFYVDWNSGMSNVIYLNTIQINKATAFFSPWSCFDIRGRSRIMPSEAKFYLRHLNGLAASLQILFSHCGALWAHTFNGGRDTHMYAGNHCAILFPLISNEYHHYQLPWIETHFLVADFLQLVANCRFASVSVELLFPSN